MYKNFLTELASKPANAAMHMCKGEASQYNSERQVQEHQRQGFKNVMKFTAQIEKPLKRQKANAQF